MKDGGLAFPCKELRDNFADSPGMTLRDYFAAAALKAHSIMSGDGDEDGELHIIARGCYAMADAMLAAREKE